MIAHRFWVSPCTLSLIIFLFVRKLPEHPFDRKGAMTKTNFNLNSLKRILLMPLICFVWGAFLTPVQAQRLKVYTINLPPWGYVERGTPQGLLLEVMEAVSKEAGLWINNEVRPLPRVLEHMASGRVDCSMLLRFDEFEDKYIPVVRVFPDIRSAVVVRSGQSVGSFEDLSGKTVAVPRGSPFEIRLGAYPQAKPFVTTHYLQSMQLLKEGSVDAVIGTLDSLYFSADKLAWDRNELATPFVFDSRDGWLWCSKQSAKVTPELIEKLKVAVETIYQNGEIHKIRNKYFNGETPPPRVIGEG